MLPAAFRLSSAPRPHRIVSTAPNRPVVELSNSQFPISQVDTRREGVLTPAPGPQPLRCTLRFSSHQTFVRVSFNQEQLRGSRAGLPGKMFSGKAKP
jgi:hypothetical protein